MNPAATIAARRAREAHLDREYRRAIEALEGERARAATRGRVAAWTIGAGLVGVLGGVWGVVEAVTR